MPSEEKERHAGVWARWKIDTENNSTHCLRLLEEQRNASFRLLRNVFSAFSSLSKAAEDLDLVCALTYVT